MPLRSGLTRLVRRAAFRIGLLADRSGRAAGHVERLLDGPGADLFARSGVPGLVVIVRFADGRTVSRCYGVAGDGRPTRTDDVVPALSLTKPVTAACVMALVERGTLDLDAPVWRYVREYRIPARSTRGFDPDAITLRGLLSHSAGIALHGHGWVGPEGFRTARELLEDEREEAGTLRLFAPARERLRYSGGGYLLAELAVEGATARPFPDVARDLVLRPFGMASSDYALTPALAARLVTSHDLENRPLPARRLLATAAAGLYGTPEDLTAFWSAFLPGPRGEPPGRGVLSPASCREMTTPQISGPDGVACGLGFYLRPRRSERRYLHLGYFEGWDHHAEGLASRGVVLTAFSNGEKGHACVPPLVRGLRRTLLEHAI